MKINQTWRLSSSFTPYYYKYAEYYIPATPKEFDKACIIHYPSRECEFKPIVLAEHFVKSGTLWNIDDFYFDVCRAVDLFETGDGYRNSLRFGLEKCSNDNFVRWGCRNFSRRQLNLIKKTMEENYTKEQLGVKA